MRCLDCGSESVIGICIHCGAAVCRNDAVVSKARLTRIAPINHPVAVDPPARQLHRTVCNAAHRAATI